MVETQSQAKSETLFLRAGEPGVIAFAADFVRQGELVAFPTDTVYGVGVDAFNAGAIERLYRAKGRPFSKGIPILLADLDDLNRVARNVPDMAWGYIHRFWPGPLTLILPRHPELPGVISPNDGIAVRMPDHGVACAFIRAAGGALAATSANLSAAPPAQSGMEAMKALGGSVAAVLDDGRSPGGIPSTIIDCMGKPLNILRQGPITLLNHSLEGDSVR